MEGSNSSGNKFVASRVYEGVPLPLPDDKLSLSEGPIKMIVACGPFSTSDNLVYEPLADLVKTLLVCDFA